MRAQALAAGVAASMMVVSLAEAGAYRRPVDAAVPGAPVASVGHAAQSSAGGVVFAAHGTQGPAYAYSYALTLPADGYWRWIEARCHASRQGEVCTDGHWARRRPGQCEEVTGHTVRRGNYIRMVPAGPVNTCRR